MFRIFLGTVSHSHNDFSEKHRAAADATVQADTVQDDPNTNDYSSEAAQKESRADHQPPIMGEHDEDKNSPLQSLGLPHYWGVGGR